MGYAVACCCVLQEKTRESERWSAEQLKEAEALDSEELKRRSVAFIHVVVGQVTSLG